MRTLAVVPVLCAALAAQPAEDLDQLLHTNQWFELRSAVTDRSPSLVRAAVATAFNDSETAERLLRAFIRSAPSSTAADDAYALLAQIYRRSGQYGRWQMSYRQWLSAIPDSARARAEKEDAARLAGWPDQVSGPPRHAVLRHDAGDFTIPVSVNGKADDYLFDTGAMTSVLTEQRAGRLGLKLDAARREIGGSSGQFAGFHTAIAREVDVGGTRFRNVSFAVLEGTSDVDFGIVGLPILVALRTIRWSPESTVEIGSSASPLPAGANLVFDRNRLLLRTRVLGRDVLTTFDTGATTTDLNANFATTFPQAVEGAKKATTAITGVGGTQTFDSLEIPEVIFGIGPAEVLLRPAVITMQRIAVMGGECCVGNAGGDLLKQAGGFTIDFSTMTLRLGDAHPGVSAIERR